MENFKNAAKKLIEFDFENRLNYKNLKAKANADFFEGVWWILTVLVLIALAVYNAWQWLKDLIVQKGWQNPKINTVLFILLFISLVITIWEKAKVFKAAKEAKTEIKKLEAEREALLSECDTAFSNSGVEIYPWWRKFDALNYYNKGEEPMFTYFPYNPICSDERGNYVAECCSGEDSLRGKFLLENISRNKRHKVFLSENIDPEKTYYRGYIAFLNFNSAEYVKSEWVEDENADSKARMYEGQLDYNERLKNKYQSGSFSTNEEMYSKGNKSYSEHAYDSHMREKRMQNYKASLGHSETSVANEGQWNMFIDYQGEIIMDELRNYAVGVIIDESTCKSLHLRTTHYEPGTECRVIKEIKSSFYKPNPERVLCALPIFPQAELDYTIKKPDNVTDEEWGLWIYSHYAEDTIFF